MGAISDQRWPWAPIQPIVPAMSHSLTPSADRPRLGILLIVFAMALISVNDMLMKGFSDRYPLHQLVLIRSCIGICVALVILQFEGGWPRLRAPVTGLHILRALLIVMANVVFFAALAVLPLGTATALFFVAPLLITAFSVPILGERVGPRRLAAIAVGFLGVLLMLDREALGLGDVPLWLLALPIIAAAAYAMMQVLTRRLGGQTPAAVLSVQIHLAFILVSLGFFLVASDGRFAEGSDNASVQFLLRAWIWPAGDDWPWIITMGLAGGGIGYALSQGYRLGRAASIAPYEYVALPMAVFWGWAVFGEWPEPRVWLGIALIAGAGVYVFWREGQLQEESA